MAARRHKPSFKALLLVAFFVGGALASLADQFWPSPATEPATSNVLEGAVSHVRDGDTIEVRGIAVRLQDVHAPELDEPGGQAAKSFMARLVLGKTTRCDLTGERSYDRRIGTCHVDGADVGAALIGAGLGRDCPRYSGGRYAHLETSRAQDLTLPSYCRR